MEPRRRIFWMLSNAFLALLFSGVSPFPTAFFSIVTAIWISHNAMVLTVEQRSE